VLQIHENHECAIHDFAMHPGAPLVRIKSVRRTGCRHIEPQRAEHHHRRNAMKWETPAASDMRFGFEITMYIANR
jgi:pyrroloquinoline quinone biosynthesis protein A